MSVDFKVTPVDGLDKELLLNVEGYLARPITVSKETISGLAPDDKGRYVIPQGTLLVGKDSSLLVDSMQLAVEAKATQTRAKATVNSVLEVESKVAGAVTYAISLVKPTGSSSVPSISFDGAKFEIKLATTSSGNVKTTYDDIVKLINNDTKANTYIVAKIADGADGTTKADATSTDVALAGGAEETVDGNIDGILYHSVDVTDGEAPATLLVHGFVNVDNMPVEPSDAVKAKLPHIMFGRID